MKEKKKKENFAVSADHSVKLDESKKRVKVQDHAREKLSKMKVTVIPIVIGTLGTVTKWLAEGMVDLETNGRIENIHYWDRSE